MKVYKVIQEKPITITGTVLKRFLGDKYFKKFICGDFCDVEIQIKKGLIHSIRILSPGEEKENSHGVEKVIIPSEQIIAPAFVDCHVHLVLDGILGFRKFIGPVSDDVLSQRLNWVLHSGVAAVRDGSDHYNTGMQAKGLSQGNMNFYPKVVTTGWGLYREGHYGSFLGQGGIREFQEVKQRIALLIKAGVDQLKVVQSGLVSFTAYGETGPAQFTLPEMREMVRIASEFDLPVMVHASSDEAVRIAVEAGVHTVEHGYFVSPQTLELMAQKGVAWVPTVAPVAAALKEVQTLGLEGSNGKVKPEVLEKTIENHLEKIKLAQEIGVTLGIGTDAGSPGVGWQQGFWQEMQYYARAGLSAETILEIASKNGAHLLGLSGEMGSIEVGKKPYFLSISEESLKDMKNFQGPSSIIIPDGC
ncbi:MAG: amidohydrolase family protein [Candidatus Contubernalis sp.]|nr:amidohydrolase family protein [Candidatus Contubernalis sp.]